jgi:hypothetical protein
MEWIVEEQGTGNGRTRESTESVPEIEILRGAPGNRKRPSGLSQAIYFFAL